MRNWRECDNDENENDKAKHKTWRNKMPILGINTTSKICEVSLKFDNQYKVLKAEKVNVHSDNLLPMIDEILQNNKFVIKDIEGIVVNIGPGSFTGIRVGVVVARTIAQLLNIKIYPVSGLDVCMFKYLTNNPNNVQKIVVMMDALRDEFYTAIYDFRGRLLQDYQILKKADICKIDIRFF